MNTLQWFREKIGKKIVVSHPDHGRGVVHVADQEHADHLHTMQSRKPYAFRQMSDNGYDDDLDPITAGILIADMVNADRVDDSIGFSGFGGGTTDGGGAGGDWDTPDSSSDSSDFSSDSSSDSSTSFD